MVAGARCCNWQRALDVATERMRLQFGITGGCSPVSIERVTADGRGIAAFLVTFKRGRGFVRDALTRPTYVSSSRCGVPKTWGAFVVTPLT